VTSSKSAEEDFRTDSTDSPLRGRSSPLQPLSRWGFKPN